MILRELNVCDNLQDQEFWHQQNPKYERQFPNKNPHRILLPVVVDDKSVVVMIRYTTNIEAAAAVDLGLLRHCREDNRILETMIVTTFVSIVTTIKKKLNW